MTYEEMSQLKRNDRLQVFHEGQWKSGTFQGSVNSSDPAMWFAFDERQNVSGVDFCTKIYTGLQFTPGYWNDSSRTERFRRETEEMADAELWKKWEVAAD